MATPLRMKRMARERPDLEKPNDDYFAYFEDDADLFKIHAYIPGPADTLYEHKFLKLLIEIPQEYPMKPPKCTHIQHSGGRIHPNLYVEGKVCLSILGTWPGEPWAYSFTVNTVLITIRSLLDNAPFKHEPGQKDDPSYNKYVQYSSWKTLLLDHVTSERNPAAKTYLEKQISKNGAKMISDLKKQSSENTATQVMGTRYGARINVNYATLLSEVTKLVDQCQKADAFRGAGIPLGVTKQDDAEATSASGEKGEALQTSKLSQVQFPPSPMEDAKAQSKGSTTITSPKKKNNSPKKNDRSPKKNDNFPKKDNSPNKKDKRKGNSKDEPEIIDLT